MKIKIKSNELEYEYLNHLFEIKGKLVIPRYIIYHLKRKSRFW